MRRFKTTVFTGFLVLFLFAGCKSESEAVNEKVNLNAKEAVNDKVNDAINEAAKENEKEKEAMSVGLNQKNGSKADVDLTELSSTMVYGEIYNIMLAPEEYVGKTIKMRGIYYANFDEESKKYYHYTIISDATACCAQGLEIALTGANNNREDYPVDETEIEVTGVFESYMKGDQLFYRIATEDIHIL